jgi:hypothetical protein
MVQNKKSAKHPGFQQVIAAGALRPTRQAQPQEPSRGSDQNVSLRHRIASFQAASTSSGMALPDL